MFISVYILCTRASSLSCNRVTHHKKNMAGLVMACKLRDMKQRFRYLVLGPHLIVYVLFNFSNVTFGRDFFFLQKKQQRPEEAPILCLL